MFFSRIWRQSIGSGEDLRGSFRLGCGQTRKDSADGLRPLFREAATRATPRTLSRWLAIPCLTATARSGRARSSPPTIRGRAAPVRVPRGPGRPAGGVGATRRQDIANDLRGSVLRRTRILSLVRLRPKCGFGALSRRFATPSRSARGTDRDIPASFPRS